MSSCIIDFDSQIQGNVYREECYITPNWSLACKRVVSDMYLTNTNVLVIKFHNKSWVV